MIEKLTRDLLCEIGEDPDRQGLVDTPGRVARMWKEITTGYQQNVDDIIGKAIFDIDYSEMVIVRDIEFFSLCEHHMLPFFGRAHVAYIPQKKVVGLSKIPRIVDVFARRLQVQERLTNQIAQTLNTHLDPIGVGVVIQGTHMCMAMRGVQKPGASMVTSSMSGVFQEDERTRSEFLSLVRTTRQEI